MKKLLIGFVLGGIGLAVASRANAASLAPFPPGPPAPPPPEPDFPPAAPVGPPDVAVSLPAGWRRLAQNEVTPSLTSAALDILKLGDKPGTKYPFQYDGMSYYAGVEMAGGKRNVSLFVKE